MPDLGPYAGTVLSAYAVTLGLIALLIGASLARHRRIKARLARLETEREDG